MLKKFNPSYPFFCIFRALSFFQEPRELTLILNFNVFRLFLLDIICLCGITHIRFNMLIKGEGGVVERGRGGNSEDVGEAMQQQRMFFIKFYFKCTATTKSSFLQCTPYLGQTETLKA